MSKRVKRGQNEGTIVKRADGRWVAVVNLGWQDGKRKRKSYYGKTRAEVAAKLNRAISDLDKGLPVTTDRQTVGDFLQHWLENSVKDTVQLRTYES